MGERKSTQPGVLGQGGEPVWPDRETVSLEGGKEVKREGGSRQRGDHKQASIQSHSQG